MKEETESIFLSWLFNDAVQYQDSIASGDQSMLSSCWNEKWQGKLKCWEKIHPNATLSTTTPHVLT
jgi:hypothetical protein